jgi:hypothetical protein
MAKPFAILQLTFPAPFAGGAETWQGEITANPADDPDAFREEVSAVLTAIKNKLKDRMQEAAP